MVRAPMGLTSSILAEARARQALRSSQLPYKGRLERASSTRNEIYLTDHHVVRVNRVLSQRLRREARLYHHLPDEPWAPQLAAAGGADHDFLIVQRKPGRPLAHWWPDLRPDQRRRAVHQLAGCLRAIHQMPTPPDLEPLAATPQLIDSRRSPVTLALLEGLDRLGANPNADPGIISLAREQVVAYAAALEPYDQSHLIHGDLTFENVLYDGHAISAVVDFEWCRGAPPDLDLDVLLRCCAYPEAHVAVEHTGRTRAADYAEVIHWLTEAYPTLFQQTNLAQRLSLYSLAFDVREALEEPVPANRSLVPLLHPYNRLVRHVSSGGHVALMLELAGLPT